MTVGFWEIVICLAVLANVVFAIRAWNQATATHVLVNSRMDEFKEALKAAALVSIAEFRKALMTEVVGVMRGPVGPRGEKGEKGDPGFLSNRKD